MPSWLINLREKIKLFLTKFYLLKNFFKQKKWLIFFKFKKKNGFIEQPELDQKLFVTLARRRWPKIKQLKYLNEVLSPTEKKKIKIFTSIAGLAFVALLTHLYFSASLLPRQGGNYTEGLIGFPKLINPLYAPLNQVDNDLSQLIFSGLLKIDKQGNLVPDLAERWEVTADQKIYTFSLQSGLRWHDGEPLTADDVIFTFEAIQNPEFKSPLAQNFENVKVEKIDETNIKFTLKEPYTPFLENMTIGLLPAHIWQEVVPVNATLADYNLRPVGAGPFKFKSLTKDKLGNIKAYSLSKNKDYLPRPPYLQEINFKFYSDYKTAAEALKNHNLDGLGYLPKELKKEVESRKDLTYHQLQLPQYTALFFNQSKNTFLKDIKFRQALAASLNKEEIINQGLTDNGQIIEAPILPGYLGYHPKIAKYNFNLDEAERLLNELGFVKKEGEQFRKKTEKKIEVELKVVLTTLNKGENYQVGQLIKKMWETAGIKVEVNAVEAAVIKSEIIKPRNFEILLFSEVVGVDPDPYPFWHSSQTGSNGLNLANFINKEADKVLEEARKISDPQQRHDKYVHFQNILNQQLPAIFLYTPKYIYPTVSRLKGFDTEKIASPAGRFSNIINWYLNARRGF